MPDDWKDGVRDIVDEWGLELSDTIAKDTNEEFVKRISTMGVEMNLVQTEALDKLILNDVAFISKTNKQIGESIISDVEKLLIEKGDWASAKEAVLKHVEDVFSGEEKIVINNIGKTSKRVFVDTALGHAVIKEVTVQRAWSGNIQAYSDMVAKSLSQKARQMGDIEAYRMTNGIVGWRRMSSLSGRTCNICASLHGRAYFFDGAGYNGMPADDGMMFEPHPNGYCYQVPIYDLWTGIKNKTDNNLDAELNAWKIQNEHSMSNLVRVGQIPTDYVVTDFGEDIAEEIVENMMFETTQKSYWDWQHEVDVDQEMFRSRKNYLMREMTADEYYAVDDYTGYGYNRINGYLQFGKKTPAIESPTQLAYTKEHIKLMNGLMRRYKLKEDKVLMRGIGDDIADELLEAGAMKYKGFSSTTGDLKTAIKFAEENSNLVTGDGYRNVVLFNAKKGTKALELGGYEAETIIHRGLELTVLTVEEIQDVRLTDTVTKSVRLIYCEIL